MLREEEILKFAEELIRAEDERKPIDPFSDRAKLSIEDAYKIQLKVTEMKTQRGEKVVGKKIGLTRANLKTFRHNST